MKKKIIVSKMTALIIVVLLTITESTIFVSATDSRSANFLKNYSLTGDGATDMANIALAQKNRSQSQFGYTEAWCADFVSDCAKLAGQSDAVPFNAAVSSLRNAVLNAGGTIVTSPRAGDLIFYYCTAKGIYVHVGLMTDSTHSIQGNYGDANGVPRAYYVGSPGAYSDAHGHSCSSGVVTYSFVRPNYKGKPIVSFYYNANGGTIASDSEYYADSNGLIHRKSDDAANLNNWDKDTRSEYGLYNASTMKLSRKNCVFLGWSMQKNSGTIYDQDDNTVTAKTFFPDIEKKSGSVTFYAQWGGREMKESEGAGQTIPDGEYWITNALSRGYYLDIPGKNFDTTDRASLQMWQNNWTEYDAFTVTYLNNGFYSIKQRTTNKALDVYNGDKRHGTDVIMYTYKNGLNQQWSIKNTTSGFTIQNRATGLFLDVSGGKVENGNNVATWEGNSTNSQYFGFIPYGAGQPIKSGTVARIGTIRGKGAYVDGAGDPGEYKNGSNVQIWNADGDNYFRFEYLNNGFYNIIDTQSGYALDVFTGGDSNYLTYSRNVQFYEKTGALEQEWALLPSDEDGYYYIVSRLNGRVLDLNKGILDNGNNIHTWSGFGQNQKWNIVTNKEFNVTPPTQTIYKKGDTLNTADWKAVMVYSDGYEHDVTKSAKVTCDLSSLGKQTATVTYENGGIKNTATFEVTVTDEAIVIPGTDVTTAPPDDGTTTTTTTTDTTPGQLADYDLTLLAGETHTIENTEYYYVYASNNSDVAAVSNSGVITALHTGEAVITVIIADGETAQIHLTVAPIMGDITANGEVNIADTVALMRWLCVMDDADVADWQAGDMNGDGRLNAVDLTLLKQILMKERNGE